MRAIAATRLPLGYKMKVMRKMTCAGVDLVTRCFGRRIRNSKLINQNNRSEAHITIRVSAVHSEIDWRMFFAQSDLMNSGL